MPYKDLTKAREYKRLWIAKQRAKEKNKIKPPLLEPSLKVEPNNVEPANSRTIEPKVEPKLLSNKVLNNQKFDILLNQIKKVEEQNNLFHYELSEFFQEKENQQLRISQLEQTISELQSQNQTLIKILAKRKTRAKPKRKTQLKNSFLLRN